jgi:hypothetical protein
MTGWGQEAGILDKRPIEMGYRVIACVIASAMVLSQTPSVWAQGAAAPAAAAGAKPDLAAAKKHYGEGEKKYKAGDNAGALVEFKAANDIKSTPQAERYIALCEDGLGHFQAAADFYDKFLAHVPDKMAAQGDEIKKRSAEIKALPGKVHIESNPPGAGVTVDDKQTGAPTPTDVELPPGQHTIKLSEPGRLPSERPVDVTFASTQTVSVDLEPEPAPAPPPPPMATTPPTPPAAPPPPPPEPRSKVPAFVTGGLAVAAAGVGTVFGVMALNDKSKFDKNPTSDTADSGDTHALIADMAFGVALTFGVTSAVLFLTKDEQPPPTSSSGALRMAKAGDPKNAITVTAVPVFGPHSGGAGLLVRY